MKCSKQDNKDKSKKKEKERKARPPIVVDIEGEQCCEGRGKKARKHGGERKGRRKRSRMYAPAGLSVVLFSLGSVRVGVRGRKRYQGRRTSGVITRGDPLGPPTDRPRSDPGSDPLAMGKR